MDLDKVIGWDIVGGIFLVMAMLSLLIHELYLELTVAQEHHQYPHE